MRKVFIMGCFVNFSNHPSSKWSKEQIRAAREYGEIIDVRFPSLDANIDEDSIKIIGEDCIAQIIEKNPTAVMCQGEFTLTFYVVNRLIDKGITCVSACTKRVSSETMLDDGTVHKESLFVFERFRKYTGECD